MELTELIPKLQALGYKTKEKKGLLSIPLPLGSRIHIYNKNQRYVVEPRFGLMRRPAAIVVECLIFLLFLPVYMGYKLHFVRLIYIVGLIGAIVWDFYRFKFTNRAKEQIESIISGNGMEGYHER